MKITHLTVEGAGRFNGRMSVQGFGDGVNVLCEPNEAGKSTLFRALRICLFERHSTKAFHVQQLATAGLSLSLIVTLGFSLGVHAYQIRKSFLRGASASLSRDGLEIARGSEADESVWSLLGIAPGSGRSVDDAAFGLLWVAQGDSFHPPKPTHAASGALNAAIEAEVGALVGGERARVLQAELARDLGVLVTEKGKAKAGGPLAAALGQVEATAAELSVIERRLAAVDAQITQVGEARQERAKVADPAQLAEMQTSAAEAERELGEARAAAARLAPLELAEAQAQAILAAAERRRDEILERAARIDETRQRQDALARRLASIAREEREALDRQASAQAEIDALARAGAADDAKLRMAHGFRAAIASATNRSALSQRRTTLADLGQRLSSADAALADNAASAEAVRELDALERDIDLAEARLKAGAARLGIEMLTSGAGQVTLDGATITQALSQPVTAPIEIQVGDLARISVVPPAGYGAEQMEARQARGSQLEALLARCGLASAGELRRAHEARREVEGERQAIATALKALGASPAALSAELARIDGELAAADRLAARTLAEAGLDALPDLASLEQHVALAEARQDEARAARVRLDAVKDGANDILKILAQELGRLDAERAEGARSLDQDLALLPDAGRHAIMAQCEAGLAQARLAKGAAAEALATLRSKTPDPAEIERLDNRCVRLRSALAQQRGRIGELDLVIANLEGQIQNAGAEGLGERAAMMTDELALWQRETERHQRRVRMLQLLHDTVARCHAEQRERLNAPIKRHLKPYLADVFAAAEPELGDGFRVHALNRAGLGAQSIDLLSDGTKEQIAVLTRLAMGSMLAERGQSVPIVLDDALVFADDDRIERMFDALARAGRQQQVIILTCRTRAFARLGGLRLSLVPG
ncbi:MAG: AAA family ATPase [Bosea sp.]|nr:AAA family ATPase [Bosea sp. (in: a-proteobacteria)]